LILPKPPKCSYETASITFPIASHAVHNISHNLSENGPYVIERYMVKKGKASPQRTIRGQGPHREAAGRVRRRQRPLPPGDPSGARRWVQRIVVNGCRRKFGLGGWPAFPWPKPAIRPSSTSAQSAPVEIPWSRSAAGPCQPSPRSQGG
jgi:hypothetical protein